MRIKNLSTFALLKFLIHGNYFKNKQNIPHNQSYG